MYMPNSTMVLASAALATVMSVSVAATNAISVPFEPETTVQKSDTPPPDSENHKNVFDSNAESIIGTESKKKPVVMVWGNYLCTGCHDMRDVVIRMANERKDFLSAYADTKNVPNLKAKYKVDLQPCTIFFWQGTENTRFVAWAGEKTARKRVNSILDDIVKPTTPTPNPTASTPSKLRPLEEELSERIMKCDN